MSSALTSNLDDPSAVPYFLWDEPMTVSELRARLETASEPERHRLLGKIMREARDTDVWRFTTLRSIVRSWDDLTPHLGRRRAFWEYLLLWDRREPGRRNACRARPAEPDHERDRLVDVLELERAGFDALAALPLAM